MKVIHTLNTIKSLSIIFPVFNESERLQASIKHIENFLKKKKKLRLELIFVDDGSDDNSYAMIKQFINKYYKFSKNKKTKLFLIKSIKNLGKGSALKLGVRKAKHDWILTNDIDMSVSLFQIYEWIKKGYIVKDNFVYFGSRRDKKTVLKARVYRKILGNIFNFFINLILDISIKDTQCGYKLYKKSSAKFIFSKLKNYGFSHDIELVLLLNSKNIKIKELPIKWKHINNGKLNIFSDSIKMFIEVFLIKFRYTKLV